MQTRALCEVPRGGLQLLPYYMRIAASLSQVFPDIGQGGREHLCMSQRSSAGASICASMSYSSSRVLPCGPCGPDRNAELNVC